MGLTRSQLHFMLATTLILAFIVMGVSLLAVLQAESYKQATIDNCKQYEIIPEKYIDKVPSGCVPQWFEANKK